jgi:hypothetical protein
MIVTKMIKDFIQYITEGFLKIFSPDNDDYPAIGVQPYGGVIDYRNSDFNW